MDNNSEALAAAALVKAAQNGVDIAAITNKIGADALTTIAQTLAGAINEVKTANSELSTQIETLNSKTPKITVSEAEPLTPSDGDVWIKILPSEIEIPVTDYLFRYDANTLSSLDEGAKVTTWEDLSENGNDLTQSDPKKQPTFMATGLNGKPTVKFDPAVYTDAESNITSNYNWMYNTPFTLDRVNGATIFMVFKMDDISASTKYPMTLGTAETPNGNIFSLYFSSSGIVRTYVNNTIIGAPAVDATSLLYTTAWDTSGGTIWKNGTLSVENTTYSAGNIGTHDVLSVGANPAGAGNIDGRVSEIVYFSRTLTVDEVNSVNAYLLEKWGFL